MCCDTTVLLNISHIKEHTELILTDIFHSCKHIWAAVSVTPNKNTAWLSSRPDYFVMIWTSFIHFKNLCSLEAYTLFDGLYYCHTSPFLTSMNYKEWKVDYDGQICLCYIKVLDVQMCCLEAGSAVITDLKIECQIPL